MRTLILILGLAIVPISLPGAERFPLGPLGAIGEVSAGSNAIVIVEVMPGAPGEKAGLRPADRIVGVSGTTFGKHTDRLMDGGRGPQKSLGEAIDTHGGQILRLTVEREDTTELEVRLPERPAFRPDFGKTCAASRALRKAAAAQLIATQKKNGMWDSPVGLTGDRVLSAWAVIALIAHGDAEQSEAIARGARWLRGPADRSWLREDLTVKGPDNLGNWALASTVVALAEHARATEKDAHRDVLELATGALVARMSDGGRFGHDVTPGYEGKGFNVINTLAHLAWASAATVDVEIDEEAWSRSFAEIETSVDDNGGIRYWTIAGTGTWDASLRTGSMALALSLTGRAPELATRHARYLSVHAPRAREAHAVGSLGMMVSAPALWTLDREGWRTFMQEWRWYLTLLPGPDGRIRYIGGKRNNGGDSYLGKDRMACIIALMLLTCPEERLRLHRRP